MIHKWKHCICSIISAVQKDWIHAELPWKQRKPMKFLVWRRWTSKLKTSTFKISYFQQVLHNRDTSRAERLTLFRAPQFLIQSYSNQGVSLSYSQFSPEYFFYPLTLYVYSYFVVNILFPVLFSFINKSKLKCRTSCVDTILFPLPGYLWFMLTFLVALSRVVNVFSCVNCYWIA